jgi:hypothetical protein
MRVISCLLGVGIVLTACKPQPPPRVDSADTTHNPQAVQQRLGKLNLQFEHVIQPDSSDHLLLPLTIRETPDGEGIIDAPTYKEVDRSYYWNVAFYNSRTGEHHLLDENRKMLIHHITVNDSEADDFGSKRRVQRTANTFFTGSSRLTTMAISDSTPRT